MFDTKTRWNLKKSVSNSIYLFPETVAVIKFLISWFYPKQKGKQSEKISNKNA